MKPMDVSSVSLSLVLLRDGMALLVIGPCMFYHQKKCKEKDLIYKMFKSGLTKFAQLVKKLKPTSCLWR